MLAYNDIGTHNFVLVYDKEQVRQHGAVVSLGEILSGAGFRSKPGFELDLQLRTFLENGYFKNPQLIDLDGGEGFLECKPVFGIQPEMVELQMGSMKFSAKGFLHETRYSAERAQRLRACLEAMVGASGFEFGFSLHLDDEENEVEYREWFAECIDHGRFSLQRLVNHKSLSVHSIAVGGASLGRYTREVFASCPGWRVSYPSPDSVCVWFDNLVPVWTYYGHPQQLTFEKEALEHLRAKLVD